MVVFSVVLLNMGGLLRLQQIEQRARLGKGSLRKVILHFLNGRNSNGSVATLRFTKIVCIPIVCSAFGL